MILNILPYAVYQVNEVPYPPALLVVFIMKGYFIFFKFFSVSLHMIMCVLSFILLIWYIVFIYFFTSLTNLAFLV